MCMSESSLYFSIIYMLRQGPVREAFSPYSTSRPVTSPYRCIACTELPTALYSSPTRFSPPMSAVPNSIDYAVDLSLSASTCNLFELKLISNPIHEFGMVTVQWKSLTSESQGNDYSIIMYPMPSLSESTTPGLLTFITLGRLSSSYGTVQLPTFIRPAPTFAHPGVYGVSIVKTQSLLSFEALKKSLVDAIPAYLAPRTSNSPDPRNIPFQVPNVNRQTRAACHMEQFSHPILVILLASAIAPPISSKDTLLPNTLKYSANVHSFAVSEASDGALVICWDKEALLQGPSTQHGSSSSSALQDSPNRHFSPTKALNQTNQAFNSVIPNVRRLRFVLQTPDDITVHSQGCPPTQIASFPPQRLLSYPLSPMEFTAGSCRIYLSKEVPRLPPGRYRLELLAETANGSQANVRFKPLLVTLDKRSCPSPSANANSLSSPLRKSPSLANSSPLHKSRFSTATAASVVLPPGAPKVSLQVVAPPPNIKVGNSGVPPLFVEWRLRNHLQVISQRWWTHGQIHKVVCLMAGNRDHAPVVLTTVDVLVNSKAIEGVVQLDSRSLPDNGDILVEFWASYRDTDNAVVVPAENLEMLYNVTFLPPNYSPTLLRAGLDAEHSEKLSWIPQASHNATAGNDYDTIPQFLKKVMRQDSYHMHAQSTTDPINPALLPAWQSMQQQIVASNQNIPERFFDVDDLTALHLNNSSTGDNYNGNSNLNGAVHEVAGGFGDFVRKSVVDSNKAIESMISKQQNLFVDRYDDEEDSDDFDSSNNRLSAVNSSKKTGDVLVEDGTHSHYLKERKSRLAHVIPKSAWDNDRTSHHLNDSDPFNHHFGMKAARDSDSFHGSDDGNDIIAVMASIKNQAPASTSQVHFIGGDNNLSTVNEDKNEIDIDELDIDDHTPNAIIRKSSSVAFNRASSILSIKKKDFPDEEDISESYMQTFAEVANPSPPVIKEDGSTVNARKSFRISVKKTNFEEDSQITNQFAKRATSPLLDVDKKSNIINNDDSDSAADDMNIVTAFKSLPLVSNEIIEEVKAPRKSNFVSTNSFKDNSNELNKNPIITGDRIFNKAPPPRQFRANPKAKASPPPMLANRKSLKYDDEKGESKEFLSIDPLDATLKMSSPGNENLNSTTTPRKSIFDLLENQSAVIIASPTLEESKKLRESLNSNVNFKSAVKLSSVNRNGQMRQSIASQVTAPDVVNPVSASVLVRKSTMKLRMSMAALDNPSFDFDPNSITKIDRVDNNTVDVTTYVDEVVEIPEISRGDPLEFGFSLEGPALKEPHVFIVLEDEDRDIVAASVPQVGFLDTSFIEPGNYYLAVRKRIKSPNGDGLWVKTDNEAAELLVSIVPKARSKKRVEEKTAVRTILDEKTDEQTKNASLASLLGRGRYILTPNKQIVGLGGILEVEWKAPMTRQPGDIAVLVETSRELSGRVWVPIPQPSRKTPITQGLVLLDLSVAPELQPGKYTLEYWRRTEYGDLGRFRAKPVEIEVIEGEGWSAEQDRRRTNDAIIYGAGAEGRRSMAGKLQAIAKFNDEDDNEE